jgi:hypothetical protein
MFSKGDKVVYINKDSIHHKSEGILMSEYHKSNTWVVKIDGTSLICHEDKLELTISEKRDKRLESIGI